MKYVTNAMVAAMALLCSDGQCGTVILNANNKYVLEVSADMDCTQTSISAANQWCGVRIEYDQGYDEVDITHVGYGMCQDGKLPVYDRALPRTARSACANKSLKPFSVQTTLRAVSTKPFTGTASAFYESPDRIDAGKISGIVKSNGQIRAFDVFKRDPGLISGGEMRIDESMWTKINDAKDIVLRYADQIILRPGETKEILSTNSPVIVQPSTSLNGIELFDNRGNVLSVDTPHVIHENMSVRELRAGVGVTSGAVTLVVTAM